MKEGDVMTHKGRTGTVYTWDDAPNIDIRSKRLVFWDDDYICIAE